MKWLYIYIVTKLNIIFKGKTVKILVILKYPANFCGMVFGKIQQKMRFFDEKMDSHRRQTLNEDEGY